MHSTRRALALFVTLLTASGALAKPPTTQPADADSRSAMTPFERDRAAILAMAGEFRVTFDFRETAAVAADYELAEPYESMGREIVLVIADEGTVIELQHILVLVSSRMPKPVVVKHWRQTWTYEDRSLLEYQGHRIWERTSKPADEVAGTWSQAVYQVDDSPRYEAVGRWTHAGEASSWLSQETWRALPRREFSTRDDYHVLVGINRQTITASGWLHEQANRKVVLNEAGEPTAVIAHEVGVNTYERMDGFDFSPAKDYWQNTHAFWATVRQAWTESLAAEGRYRVDARYEDKPVYASLFEQAEKAASKDDAAMADARKNARKIVDACVHPLPSR